MEYSSTYLNKVLLQEPRILDILSRLREKGESYQMQMQLDKGLRLELTYLTRKCRYQLILYHDLSEREKKILSDSIKTTLERQMQLITKGRSRELAGTVQYQLHIPDLNYDKIGLTEKFELNEKEAQAKMMDIFSRYD